MDRPDVSVPPLDDDLGDALDDLAGFRWLPGIAQILDGIETAATTPLTADQTQTMCAVIAGSAGADLLSLLGLLVQRLTNPTSNPCLRQLPEDQRKQTQRYGEQVAFDLLEPDLHQAASEASAAITGT
jgi:hypothetical protein